MKNLHLYLITDDRARPLAELATIVDAALRGGVTAVQYREKSIAPADISSALQEIGAVCALHGAPLLVNGDVVAKLGDHEPLPAGVAGLHLSSRTWSMQKRFGAGKIIGYSAHSIAEAQEKLVSGVDFVTLSPIYETPSKSGILQPIGLQMLRASRAALGEAPVVALGGIDRSNAADVIRAGAMGIAVMRAIMSAADSEKAARELRGIVDGAW